MKFNINFKNVLSPRGPVHLLIGVFVFAVFSCEQDQLPGTGSIEDKTPPSADFSYTSEPGNDLQINFGNLSTSAIAYTWDFGDGGSSQEKEPSHQYPNYGTYKVTLTATDGLGVSSTISKDVEVVAGPYQPFIREPGFEDLSEGAEACGSGLDGRDCWRNSTLGGVIQITSSPVRSGSQAAKLPGNGDKRIGYQEIAVEANSAYQVNFYYTMLNNAPGFLTVSILGNIPEGGFASHDEAVASAIASITVNDQSDPATYVGESIKFSSKDNTTVAIYFYNNGTVESRLDDFSIDIAEPGAVPPSASFTYQQSEADYLTYSFTNTSLNATSYTWDFGDGNTSTEVSPEHTYATANKYTVKLTATNEVGLSASFSAQIDIQAPVTAAFTYEVDPADYKTYTFTDASVGAVSLLWKFGDGYQFTGNNPRHTYLEDGIYTVSLTATSITGLQNEATAQITVAEGFVVKVLNGTFDEYTVNTGDNADAWDMTPNSTVVDNNGNTIDSPYRALWNNTELNAYIDATYCTNEQPATTSDGTYNAAGEKTRGAKFSNSCRRLYQLVEVRQGTSYMFSIDTRSEAEGVNTEVFILNTEITTETGIDASKSDPAIDAYFNITNDFNPSPGDASTNTFTRSTFSFVPSTNHIVIYVRALNAVDGDHEVFLDNVEITEN